MNLKRHRGPRGILSAVACVTLGLVVTTTPVPAANLNNVHIFFEFNFTDNDLGVQVFLDAPAWRSLTIMEPYGTRILQLNAQGALGVLGLTELFWESDEPSPAEVLAKFPPGRYQFEITDVDGKVHTGMAMLSHDLPAPSVVLFPEENGSVEPDDLTVRWTHPQPSQLVGFQVIVTNETSGIETATFTLPASATQVHVAPEALAEPGKKHKIEVLAISKNENKTIVEVAFTTK
jgi:hypothetical protein